MTFLWKSNYLNCSSRKTKNRTYSSGFILLPKNDNWLLQKRKQSKKQSVIVKTFFLGTFLLDNLLAVFNRTAEVTSFCWCLKKFLAESIRNQDFMFFFIDYNFAQNVPLDTHNNVLKTLPLSWCRNSRVCCSKSEKKSKNHCNKMILSPESWTSCMLFLTKLPKKRIFAVVRTKITKSPFEIMILGPFYSV